MMLTAWRRPTAAQQNDFQRILFVEPVARIVELMRDDLEMAGYDVTHAGDGRTALRLIDTHRFDLVVLDSVLPDARGLAILATLVDRGLPVVWLTRHFDVVARTAGRQSGAAAVLAMPFGSTDLVVSVRRALRKRDETTPLTYGPLRVDGGSVLLDGAPVLLSRTERALLMELVDDPGRLRTRRELMDTLGAQTGDPVSEDAVDKVFMSLSHKLGRAALHFETVWGAGYRFVRPTPR